MADYWTAGAAETNGTAAPAAATADAAMEDDVIVSKSRPYIRDLANIIAGLIEK